jgi:hypothetical protein
MPPEVWLPCLLCNTICLTFKTFFVHCGKLVCTPLSFTLFSTIDCNLGCCKINVLRVGSSGLVFRMEYEFVSWRLSNRSCWGCQKPWSSFRYTRMNFSFTFPPVCDVCILWGEHIRPLTDSSRSSENVNKCGPFREEGNKWLSGKSPELKVHRCLNVCVTRSAYKLRDWVWQWLKEWLWQVYVSLTDWVSVVS